MFVPYVLANATREFEMRTRPRKIELATMCKSNRFGWFAEPLTCTSDHHERLG